jgi:hypothetical protein
MIEILLQSNLHFPLLPSGSLLQLGRLELPVFEELVLGTYVDQDFQTLVGRGLLEKMGRVVG